MLAPLERWVALARAAFIMFDGNDRGWPADDLYGWAVRHRRLPAADDPDVLDLVAVAGVLEDLRQGEVDAPAAYNTIFQASVRKLRVRGRSLQAAIYCIVSTRIRGRPEAAKIFRYLDRYLVIRMGLPTVRELVGGAALSDAHRGALYCCLNGELRPTKPPTEGDVARFRSSWHQADDPQSRFLTRWWDTAAPAHSLRGGFQVD